MAVQSTGVVSNAQNAQTTRTMSRPQRAALEKANTNIEKLNTELEKNSNAITEAERALGADPTNPQLKANLKAAQGEHSRTEKALAKATADRDSLSATYAGTQDFAGSTTATKVDTRTDSAFGTPSTAAPAA